jgi:hypothetical protein
VIISSELKNSILKILKSKHVIKNSSLVATELNVCKEVRKTLNENDQIIFDMMINHAMKCENKVPLGFDIFLKRVIGSDDFLNLKFKNFHFSDIDYFLNNCQYEITKNFVDFLLNKRGLDNDIFFENSYNNENSLELVNGYQFKGKNLLNLNSVSYLNCAIILIDGVILNVSEIHHLLTYLSNVKIPTLLICRDYENDVLNTLIVNFRKDTLKVIPIKSSIDDIDNLNIFSDLSSVTGSDVVTKLKGDLISNIKPENLKFVDKITFYNDNFIIENEKTQNQVLSQIKILKDKMKELEDSGEVNKYSLFENRIKSLTSKNSIIRLKNDIHHQFIKFEINKILRLLKHGIKFGIEKDSNIPMSTYIITKNHYDDFINTISNFQLII